MSFETTIFVNCPFDKEYQPLLRTLLFTIIFLEYSPAISETMDSASVRVNDIKELIRRSKFSIHDLSRIEPLTANELPRFNMPFELGLDFGCKAYGNDKMKQKQCLILEKEPYRYQKVLSDISGNDIEAHFNDAETLIGKVRNWVFKISGKKIPSGSRIWIMYNEFYTSFIETLKSEGFNERDIDDLPRSEYVFLAKTWIESK